MRSPCLTVAAVALLTSACDDDCVRLSYVDLYGPDATSRTVVVNALSCLEDREGLWLHAAPLAGSASGTLVNITTIPAGTCLQVGHPAVQWGTEFVPAVFGGASPWPEYAVRVGSEGVVLDEMTTSGVARRDVASPLRADEDRGWHPVGSYGGQCALLAAP